MEITFQFLASKILRKSLLVSTSKPSFHIIRRERWGDMVSSSSSSSSESESESESESDNHWPGILDGAPQKERTKRKRTPSPSPCLPPPPSPGSPVVHPIITTASPVIKRRKITKKEEQEEEPVPKKQTDDDNEDDVLIVYKDVFYWDPLRYVTTVKNLRELDQIAKTNRFKWYCGYSQATGRIWSYSNWGKKCVVTIADNSFMKRAINALPRS